MRIIRFFLKIVALLLVLAILVIGFASAYIAFNKKELSDKFLSVLKEEVDLDIKYSNFDISLISHFPFAALNFEDLSIDILNKSETTKLLSAQNLSLTVNSINLIRGNFSIRNCIIETGEINYYPHKIDSLLNHFSSEASSVNNQNINIKKFNLKNYIINIYDAKNKLSIKMNVNKSFISIYLNGDKLHSSLKADLAKLHTESFQSKFPISIQLIINKENNRCMIENLELKTNKILINANGQVNLEKGYVALSYSSNSFNIKNLQELLSINNNDMVIKAKSKISGKVDFNINSSTVDNLIINHVSVGKVLSKEKNFIVNELVGKTQFTNNFKNHITSISKANIEYDNISTTLTARIKGLNNPVVLAEGLVKLNRYKKLVGGREITISASGNFKALLSLKQTNKQLDIAFHHMSGLINFNIDNIDGIDKITDIKGMVDFKDDITIKSTGNIDNKPIKLSIKQNNFVSVLNNKIGLNPDILVDAEEIDLSLITEIISNAPENKESKPNNNTYRVKVDTKNLKYMNYAFKEVHCRMLFSDNTLEIQNFIGNGFNGTLSGSMLNSGNKYFIKTDFEQMNISELFKHYDNFKQNIVTHNNISGNLSGSAMLNFTTNDKGEIVMPSIKMESDITISNGKLTGMNKIEKLSKWLKLDQVKSIDFKTLQNKIEISDGCVKIPKMDVLSNVINMQLSGEHYFAGNFTYWMKINFSQILSRRFLNSTVTNDNEHSTDGSINLYLKLFGDDNSYEVKLDKKSSFEKIRDNIQAEGKALKEIFREEFNQISKKDTILKSYKDSSLNNKTKFNIEWDEYDTLNVDNN